MDESQKPPSIEVVSGAAETLQCQHCTQLLPRSKFTDTRRQWCIYCIADEVAEQRDKTLRLKAEELSRGLMQARNADQVMSTIEDFFGELDISLGGPRMVASRMAQIIDGLMEKRSFTAAGNLLLQLEKLRFLVQRQHMEDDFTQMDLEQKRAKLQLLLTEMLLEQADDDNKKHLMSLLVPEGDADAAAPTISALDAITTLSR